MEDGAHLRKIGYLLGGRINSGAFSIVHCGLEVKSGDAVAIKVTDLKNVSGNFRRRFLPRELANIKRFNHPNIIKVCHISRNEHKVYIVMDYACSSLRREIDARTYIAERQARKWFFQLASAIEYLKRNRIAHRDIKIDNILIDHHQNIKLCDFGFSKLIEGNSSSNSIISEQSTTYCGSIAYCAPEILLRTPYDPWKSDVWSLGVVLYKMVVGVMPFGEGNDLASVRKIARAQNRLLEFPPFPPTSYDCQQLIRALLTVESTQRIDLSQVTRSRWMKPSNSNSSVSTSVSRRPSLRSFIPAPLRRDWSNSSGISSATTGTGCSVAGSSLHGGESKTSKLVECDSSLPNGTSSTNLSFVARLRRNWLFRTRPKSKKS